MRRPGIEGFDWSYRDSLSTQVVEHVGVLRADHVNGQIASIDTGDVSQGCEPAQRIEMETRIIVDDTAEPPFGSGSVNGRCHRDTFCL